MRFSRLTTVAGLAVALSGASSSIAAAATQMPQMDFADPLTLAQVAWMAVIMIILYVLMAWWALPRVSRVIESRKRRINNDLEAASQFRIAVDQTIAKLDRAIHDARNEGQATIAKAVSDAKEKTRAEMEALNARLEAEWTLAKGEIEQARRAAEESLRPMAEDLIHALVEKLIGRHVDGTAVAEALDAVEQ